MWYFKTIERGTPERNPREAEFFRLTSPSEAVVREFIQNSLDARKNQRTIKVRISFQSVSKRDVAQFVDDTLKQHLRACELLGEDYPVEIPCLVLEDFGTTGLDGSFLPDVGKGNFYDFWWREGISEKAGQRAGRWGLGKITFHIISKIKTFWGLTVRDDGRELLMGKALLKTHTIGTERFQYFGYFSAENGLPVEDDSVISEFKNHFKITRNSNETGLSIVIPLPDDEINFNSALKAVIQHYFFPVLAGTIKVTITDSGRNETMDANNLVVKAAAIDWRDTKWEGIDIHRILEFVKTTINEQHFIMEIANPENPEITPQSFGTQLNTIKTSFLDGRPVKIRIPLHIRKIDGSARDTWFIVLLKRFPEFRKAFECYIRAGIMVTEVRVLGNRPVAALLVAEDEPVCEFLGDCETPAHTNWNERTEGFDDKYINAARVLRFIKKSMSQIVSILDEPPHERQADFLKEIFSIPREEEEGEKKETTQPPDIPPIERKIPLFNISSVRGGFSVILNPGGTGISLPLRATVRVAYDTRGGNPFSLYEKFDFDLSSSSINIAARDCNILNKILNKLELEMTGQNFRLEVTGFDPNRDLVVDIKRKDHEA